MQLCSRHGRGKPRFSMRHSARVFHLTISLLLVFLASCEKTQPSNPALPPEPPVIRGFRVTKKDLDKERTELQTWHTKIEEARKANSIKESEYKAGIGKYEQRIRKNEADLKQLKPEN